ncbi:BON domain-containing protein [Cupriavidus agavae]|uniref:BON domain-containing protein n=1 Tax=Cupriavidus agavae TaxID=1001822 RepID=A0A4Q7S082_9BURK|nr:BON domain-containing protein [Cupriavidus agavae]RZT39077.1 BON domain-containing protein [Cupriavidus agavae]
MRNDDPRFRSRDSRDRREESPVSSGAGYGGYEELPRRYTGGYRVSGSGSGSEWTSQRGSQDDELGQGRPPWDEPGDGRGSQRPDMRTHYRGEYGVADFEPPPWQSYQTWQRAAATEWLEDDERQAGPGDPERRAYEHFTGAEERSSLNRGYGGAGGSAMARHLGEGTGHSREAERRKGPKGYQRSDTRIREDLCERLSLYRSLDVREVEVSVTGGIVTLAGTVRNREQKRRIEDIADDIFGVNDVQNDIQVRP